MNEVCEKDIKIHYNLLGHSGQTEVRTFTNGGRSNFVYGADNFVKLASKLNETESVYLGINQRTMWGKSTKDVIGLNAFYFDIECEGHTTEFKNDAFILSLKVFNELTSAGLKPVLADSGGGYHIFLGLDSEIVIDDSNRDLIWDLLHRVKEKYINIRTEKSIIDITNVSIGRTERIIGTFNHRHGVMSKWLTKPVKTETSKFVAWLHSLPIPKVHEPEQSGIGEIPVGTLSCMILEYACSNKLPEGSRNQIICPNFMATNPTSEQIDAFASAQQMDINEVVSWAKSDCWKGKFYCAQLRKYANQNELGYLCQICNSIKKQSKDDIVINLDEASGTQPQEPLILL